MKNNRIAIINGTIVTPISLIQNGTLVIENQRIKQVGHRERIKLPKDAVIINAANQLVVPGFIDLHLQGAYGYDVWDEPETALPTLCKNLLQGGTTAFLATTEFHPPTISRLSRFLATQNSAPDSEPAATCIGIHLEGPFINPERKGGIPGESIQPPSKKLLKEIERLSQGNLKMLTIAPELLGTIPIIQHVVDHGIIAAIGHTNASFAEAKRSFDAGITHTTHIFNQMTPIHHRNSGATLACLLDDRISVQVICDGIHLDWEIIKLIYRLKGANRMVLITDAIRAAGLPDGIYHSQGHGRKIIVKNGKVTRPDGTIAGSTLTMNRAVANAVHYCQIPLKAAIRMATLTPAQILGVSHRIGSIAPNREANIVVLDNRFRVKKVFVKGVIQTI
ncbi:MAG: N-acetylglucosamine-6-phosphate deacetylase [bacterium]|nr:N-acetylglucosamine-6-phosphate deacetylase [bacterium]